MPYEVDWKLLKDIFVQVTSGVVGGGLSLAGVHVAHSLGKKKDLDTEKKTIQSVISALHVEIKVLHQVYMAGTGTFIENVPDGEIYRRYFVANQDYFVVYKTNCNRIGSIQDSALRDLIVMTYTSCMALIDMLTYYNGDLRRYSEFLEMQRRGVDMSAEMINLGALYSLLLENTGRLKTQHFQTKDSVVRLLEKLHPSGE